MHILNTFKDNLTKFRKFTQTILNPSTISKAILDNGNALTIN